jgi:outer membrane protein
VRKIRRRMQGVLAGGVASLLAASPLWAQQVTDERVAELIEEAKALIAKAQPPADEPDQAVVHLTLDEAVDLALEQNLDIEIERINPQVSDLTIAQVRSAYTPMLSWTVGDSNQIQLPRTQLVGGLHAQNDQKYYNAGFTQALPWFGGTASVSWNNSRVFNTASFQNYNPQFITGLSVSYTQPLLRNFRIDSTRQQLETSRISHRVADVQLRAVVTNTVANVKNAYWDLLYTVHAVDVARTSLDLAEKLVEDNKTRVEIGTLAPIDIVQAEAEAATRRQALVQAEAARRTAELALKRLIVGSTDDPLWRAPLDLVDRPPTDPEPIDLEAAVRYALNNRTDISQAREQIRSSDVTVRYQKNQRLPNVDISATYGLQGIGGTFHERQGLGGSVSSVIPGGYSDALGLIWSSEYPQWSFGVTMSYPIGTSAADANYSRAQLQYQQAQARIKQIELQAVTELTNAALQVESSRESFLAGKAARELAQQRLEAEQSKFEVGMSTNFFVVQAQRDSSDAQIAELRAVLNYVKSLVDFQRLQDAPMMRSTTGIISTTSSTTGRTSGISTTNVTAASTGGTSRTGGSR